MEKQWEVAEAVGGAVEPAVADADGVLRLNICEVPNCFRGPETLRVLVVTCKASSDLRGALEVCPAPPRHAPPTRIRLANSANSFTFPVRLMSKFGNGNVSIATASL